MIRTDLQGKVNQLKSMISQSVKDPQKQDKIQGVLDSVKDGKDLKQALNSLSSDEKTMVANTINTVAEPPECLKDFITNGKKNWSQSQGDDCALRQVESAEKDGSKNAPPGSMSGMNMVA